MDGATQVMKGGKSEMSQVSRYRSESQSRRGLGNVPFLYKNKMCFRNCSPARAG